MQVEAIVENVQPRPHRLDGRDGAVVDLDAAAVADEAHDRHGVGRGPLEKRAGCGRLEPAGQVLAHDIEGCRAG